MDKAPAPDAARRLRVVISSRIYRPEPAAASLFLGSVADAFTESGHEVEVLTVTAPGARRREDIPKGSTHERIRRFPVLRDRTGYVRGYAQYMSFDIPLAFRLLFSKRPDAVFVEPPPTTGAVVRVICALRRVPYVYDAADIWSDAVKHATSSLLVARMLRRIERFAMKGATAMCTISDGVVERVRELGVKTPMTVTGFGADTSVFDYVEASIEKTFIYAGTYTELHGADILIDAFAQFNQTHPEYRLRFIGNGTQQKLMREDAARLGVAGQVEFCEPISAEELAPQLSRAVASLATLDPNGGYAYAFTSKAYSSLASGCPVIFSGTGPTEAFVRQAVDSEGIPVGAAVAYDAAAIAEAMRTAADAPLPAAQRHALSAWTTAQHSMIATGRRVRDLITSVVHSGGVL